MAMALGEMLIPMPVNVADELDADPRLEGPFKVALW
jgi:hypothetical protein